MIEVRYDIVSDVTTFLCPNCGVKDIIHCRQNKVCYGCSEAFGFSIPWMKHNKDLRIDYHFGRKQRCLL